MFQKTQPFSNPNKMATDNKPDLHISTGSPEPYGVTLKRKGHNFAIFSPEADTVVLLLYFDRRFSSPFQIPFDKKINRTGGVWHIEIEGLPAAFHYNYKIGGPHDKENGSSSDPTIALIDPYAKSISGFDIWGRNPNRKIKSGYGYYESSEFDWEGDQPLNIPLRESIIYELHVRGFTKHASSRVAHPGTYSAIAEKIDYLKKLGITAVELMPINEFDETDCPFSNSQTGEPLLNYWGYSTINFFSLKSSYASDSHGPGAVVEFKEMVKALHRAGIEVIMDVVFNHTAERGRDGFTINFKGFANNIYYLLDRDGDYKNYSGCGNTMNCNHPVVRKMIMDALHYWVVQMHVDGFRFDLASILTRDEQGSVMPNPPLIESIAKDPILTETKIIAEAWDAAGAYQVGSFPAFRRWAEWNGKYRDIMRMFCSGVPGLTSEVASRIAGSEDLYKHSERTPCHSINFITAHDGFTMMDLVSYSRKHNMDNGENGKDGTGDNFSLNFGIEGPADDREVSAKRLRQVRNMATVLLLSQGTPMILSGDEFGRSQNGNNNAWCQDNAISWVNWDLLASNRELFLFWQKLIRFRKTHPILRHDHFFTGDINPFSGIADISWHNTKASAPEFHSPVRSLAFLIDGKNNEQIIDDTIYVAMNFFDKTLDFELPTVHSPKNWNYVLSTADPANFIADREIPLPANQHKILVEPFSVSVLTIPY